MKVCVLYHHFPHYREPVLTELARSGKHEYEFYASTSETSGIKPFKGNDAVKINEISFKKLGRLWIISGYIQLLFSSEIEVIIVIGNPNMPASWVLGILGRFFGKKIVFWTHGWLSDASGLKAKIRNFYLSLPDRIFLYGNRAKSIGISQGFRESKLTVIYNSLDFQASKRILSGIEGGTNSGPRPRDFFINSSLPVVICSARLIPECEFDLLFSAALELRSRGIEINILLVGDGPEKAVLTALAATNKLNVHFFGACYDEAVVGSLIYYSDITVSPGKVGLTAIHSLSYGTPVITHGNLNAQMPEVEAITAGVTGQFFAQGDCEELADAIATWIVDGSRREIVRANCMSAVEAHWTPAVQRALIDEAVSEL